MTINHLTSPTAVKQAFADSDRLGRETFLSTYGFKHSREYPVKFEGKTYDSKAVAAVAFGFQFPDIGHLRSHNLSGGIGSSGAARRLFVLGFDVAGFKRDPKDWTRLECELTCDVYFDCLGMKLSGKPFNRREQYRRLHATLGRSEKAIEWKFENIDAVLLKAQLPRLAGGVAPNVQKLLEYVVLDPLAARIMNLLHELPPAPVSTVNIPRVDPPTIALNPTADPMFNAIRTDFAKREANNRRLGQDGERFVFELEKERLLNSGERDLALRVQWVSQECGDGRGYDIESFDEHGEVIFIEVKSTNLGIDTPFFISANELAAADRWGLKYRLYRVFNLSSEPRFYVLNGPLRERLSLVPKAYLAEPNGSC
jgi:hypothetical protein